MDSLLNNRVPYPHHIADEVYRELAELVRIEAENSDESYSKISVEVEHNGTLYALDCSGWLSFDCEISPCGRPMVSLNHITPCWVELHAYDQDGEEIITDYDYNQLKHYL